MYIELFLPNVTFYTSAYTSPGLSSIPLFIILKVHFFKILISIIHVSRRAVRGSLAAGRRGGTGLAAVAGALSARLLSQLARLTMCGHTLFVAAHGKPSIGL